MIVGELKLVSANGPARNRTLGTVVIVNDGTGTKARGNYEAVVSRGKGSKSRHARIEGFARGSRSVWELLRRTLNKLAEEGRLP